jgi:hypothetical protein
MDLDKTQAVSFAPGGDTVLLARDEGSALRLNASDGKTLDSFDGIERVFEGPSGLRLLQRRRGGYIVDGPVRVLLPQEAAMLSIAFGKDEICISEVASSLRCFDLNGGLRWRFQPINGSHFVRLWYSDQHQLLFAVNYDYDNKEKFLVAFDRDGAGEELTELGPGDAEASPLLDRIVTTIGNIYCLSNGEWIGRANFER